MMELLSKIKFFQGCFPKHFVICATMEMVQHISRLRLISIALGSIKTLAASLFSRGTEKKHWFEMGPVDLFLVDI